MSHSSGGSNSSTISGSSDLTINNIANNDVIAWNSNNSNWNNKQLYPLGSAENPQTNYAAARNAAIPVNWWACSQTPTNWIAGDIRINLS